MKRFLFASCALALLTLAAPLAQAQTGTARGRVVDDKDQGIADVKIKVEYLGGVTRVVNVTTNKKGEYTQVGLQPGMYKFTAAKDGYQGGYLETKVNLGEVTPIPDIKLHSMEAARAAAQEAAGGSLAGPFKAALELLQANKLTEAEAAFTDLAAKNPSVPQIHYNLGQIHLRQGDNAGAEAAYRKAIEADAGYVEGYIALSNLFMTTRQMDKALELSQKAAADNPGEARLQLQLGVVLFNSNKYDEAGAAFTKALAVDPAMSEANYYLGTIAVTQNKVAEAVSYLEKYMASNPPAGQNRQAAEGLLGYLKPKK
jgi:tetratricopeptide (TPR) repeat protein